MRRLRREEEGVALISAIIILSVVLALGTWLLMFANGQQHQAYAEQTHEASYSMAEAALNAQIAALAVNWPTSSSPDASSCNNATASTGAGCPSPTFATGGAYSLSGGGNCPAGTPSDAWGAPMTNGWTTYVRDDGIYNGTDTSQLYNSTAVANQPAYDANLNGTVWVRAVGVFNCQVTAVIEKVSEQTIPLSFPLGGVSADAVSTSNSGKKVVVNMLGSAGAAALSLRCLNGTTQLTRAQCENVGTGQVAPDTFTLAPANSTPAIPSTDLTSLQALANMFTTTSHPTVYTAPNCPTSMSQLTSVTASGSVIPVYVSGCNMSFTTGTANTVSSPGFLIVSNGTLSLNGNSTFYGLIYAPNQQGCAYGQAATTTCPMGGDVIKIHGTGNSRGALAVDGFGTISFGASAQNFIYDNSVFPLLHKLGNGVPTPNTFRVLPSGQ